MQCELNVKVMDKFFEAIKEKREALTKSIFSNVLPPNEELEKGRKPAEIGEIREWSGYKYQKTANGWVPYRGGTNPKDSSKTTKDSEHDREVSSLKEELDHHYGELDNLERKKKDYISQHGEEKYNERHKKIEGHIESVRKELDKFKSSTKTTKKTSSSSEGKKGNSIYKKKLVDLTDEEFNELYEDSKERYNQIIMSSTVNEVSKQSAYSAMKKLEDEKKRRKKKLGESNSSTKKETPAKKTIYSVSYIGSDGKTHTEHFDDKDAAEDFKANVRPVPARSFIF